MKKIATIILLCIVLCGCNEKQKIEENAPATNYKEILKENNYVIIDVRTKEEYESGHIKDAINIPYNEINEMSDIPKDKQVLVYCKSGVRSAKAYKILKELNYEVYDLGSIDNIDLPIEEDE